MPETLAQEILRFATGIPVGQEARAADAVQRLRMGLNAGTIRAAERDAAGAWQVNGWVKAGILLGFRLGVVRPVGGGGTFPYFDKDSWPLKPLTLEHGVRVVPGGTSIRDGCYVARGVVVMPPAFINVGAYVDEGTMVDSHALVGSCAQIGKRVHLSGGVGIGGVLEPLQANPTIIEDDCFIGARSEVVEGVIVGQGSVLSMGVFLTATTKIVDRKTGEVHRGYVPPYSVVVPGSLPDPHGVGPSLSCAVIVKTVDAQTRSKTSINDLLRD